MDIIFSTLVIIALLLAVVNEFYAHKLKVSAVPTLPWVRKQMLILLQDNIDLKDGDVIYELGSGWGGLAFVIAKQYPNCQVKAVELSPVPYYMSKFKQAFSGLKNLDIKRQDFFDLDLKDAKAIAVYLSPYHLDRLEEKFNEELAKGVVIVANGFPLNTTKPLQTVTTKAALEKSVYLYRV